MGNDINQNPKRRLGYSSIGKAAAVSVALLCICINACAEQWVDLRPDGIPASQLLVDPTDTDVLIARSNRGIARSDNSGDIWQVNGNLRGTHSMDGGWRPSDRGGAVFSIWLTDISRIYRSKDAGTSFSELSTNLPATQVWRIAAAKGGASRLYLSTRDVSPVTHRIYRSDDGGEQWLETAGSPGEFLQQMAVDPTNPDIVYASSNSPNGMFRTADAGATWHPINNGLGPGNINQFALGAQGSQGRILYLAASDQAYRSLDSGDLWQPLSGGPGVMLEAPFLSVFADPDMPGFVLFGGNRKIFFSTNSGESWSLHQNYEIARVRSLIATPASPNRWFAGMDGWIARTLDWGFSWMDTTQGAFGIGTVAMPASPPGIPDRFWSFRGEDLRVTDDQGQSWSPLTREFVVPQIVQSHPLDPDSVFVIDWSDGLHRSTDGGSSFDLIASSELVGGFPTELSISESNPEHIIFRNASSLAISFDGGQNWASVNAPFPSGTIQHLRISPLVDNRVLAFCINELWLSQDGGLTWNPQGMAVIGTPVAAVLSAQDPERMYLTNFNEWGLSTDLGLNWQFFSNPGCFWPRSLAENPHRPGHLALQCDSGSIWQSFNAGDSWTEIPTDTSQQFSQIQFARNHPATLIGYQPFFTGRLVISDIFHDGLEAFGSPVR